MAAGVGGGTGEVRDGGAIKAHDPLVRAGRGVDGVEDVEADGAEVAPKAVENAVGAESAVGRLVADIVEQPPLLRRAPAAALPAVHLCRCRRGLIVLPLHRDSRI